MSFDFLGFGSKHESSSSDQSNRQADITTRDVERSTLLSFAEGGNTIVGTGEGSTDYSATTANVSGTGNTVNMLDGGAVSRAMDALTAGIEQAGKLASDTQAQASGLLSGIFDRQAQAAQQLAGTVESIKTSDVRVMAIGALAIVAYVVARGWKG